MLYISIFLLVGLFFAGMGQLFTHLPDSHTGETAPPIVGFFFGAFGLGMAALVAASMFPALLTAWALWSHRPWAKILAGATSLWSLFNMPLGTALGIWTLYILFKDGLNLSAPPPED